MFLNWHKMSVSPEIWISSSSSSRVRQTGQRIISLVRNSTAKYVYKRQNVEKVKTSNRIDSFTDQALPKPPTRVYSFHYGLAYLDDRTNRFTGKTQGYHFGARFSAVVTAIALIANLAIFIYEIAQNGGSFGVTIIQEGDCSNTKTLATWLHLIINVLSTGLLGCSNYTMQCLASPTRKEIDKAHQQGTWMEIGVPSLSNLGRISKERLAVWILLGISSIPLHLLYNSVVFSTLSSHEYSAYNVTQKFLVGDPWNANKSAIDGDSYGYPDRPPSDTDSRISNLFMSGNGLQRMDNKACLSAYSNDIISKYGDV